MTTLTVYPNVDLMGVPLTVYAEDLVTPIPSGGAVVTYSGYYAGRLREGMLVTGSALGGGGPPIVVDERAYALTPEMFGAVGDGVTDDSAACQAALTLIRDMGGGTLLLTRDYLCEELAVYSNTVIAASGLNAVLTQKLSADTHACLMRMTGTSTSTAGNVKNVSMSGFAMKGSVLSNGFSQFQHLVNMTGVSDVAFSGMRFLNWRGDAIVAQCQTGSLQERHNERLYVTGCYFDGGNNDNRNALSFIDVTTARVIGNDFVNCSRSDMPGPVDFEPDTTTSRIVDCTVSGNTFANCGGLLGGIGFYLKDTQAAMTTPVKGIVIDNNSFASDCTFASAIAVIQKQTASATTPAQGVTISSNHANGGTFRPYNIGGMRNVVMFANDWQELSGGNVFGGAGSDRNYDLTFGPGERYTRIGKTAGIANYVYDNTKIKVVDVVASGCGKTDGSSGVVYLFESASSSDDVNLQGLTVVPGGRTTNTTVKQASHTFINAANNRKRGWVLNGVSGGDFVALATFEELIVQQNVTVGVLAAGAGYVSANFACTGAAAYDSVRVSGSAGMQGCLLTSSVTPGFVQFSIVNPTAGPINLGNMDYTMWVVKS